MIRKLSATLLASTLLITNGCSRGQHTEHPSAGDTVEREGEDVPAWTTWENWTEAHDGKTYVFAVGLDDGLDLSEDDARAAASARAAEALARFVRDKVSTYLTRGGDRTTARVGRTRDEVDEGEHDRTTETARSAESVDRLLRAVELVSSVSVHGAETVFFLSERRGVVYARARVSLDDLLHAFEGELSKQVDAHARATFAEARTLMNDAIATDPATGHPVP